MQDYATFKTSVEIKEIVPSGGEGGSSFDGRSRDQFNTRVIAIPWTRGTRACRVLVSKTFAKEK